MQITSVMVVILIGWCVFTILTKGYQPVPLPANLKFNPKVLGWLKGTLAPSITVIAVLIGLGHSLLAMSGEESLAQILQLRMRNLPIHLIIPDGPRQNFLDNLIGGLSMYLAGPLPLRP